MSCKLQIQNGLHHYLANKFQFLKLKVYVSKWMVRSTTGSCTNTISLHSVHVRLLVKVWSPVTSTNAQMTLELLGLSEVDRSLSTQNHLVAWCRNNHIILNWNKTKEVIVEF